MIRRLIGFVMLIFLSGAGIRAADEAPKPPATQPVAISLADKKVMDANVGKEVVVEGTVSDAQWSPSGKVFLMKFKDSSATHFQGAVFSKSREAMEKAFNGDLSSALEGSKIQITGKLQLYRERPEIMVSDPKQITILVKGPGNSPHAAPATQPAATK